MIWTQYQDIPTNWELVGTYQRYTQQVYDKVQYLIQAVDGVFMDVDDKPNLKIPKMDSDTMLNRAVYLWTLQVSQCLQDVLNTVVDVFNAHGLVDEITNENTGYLTIWQPHRIAVDDKYRKKLNSNYKSANALLDRLLNYIKPYLR